jgi:uncharacterized membrane protein
MPQHIEESVEVDVPIRAVYNQWTQFEEFPSFMEGVKSVRQLGDKSLAWKAEIAGKEVEWTSEITQQEPDTRIGWRSTGGSQNAGSASFAALSPQKTRVTLRITYEPDGGLETAAAMLGIVKLRVKGDVERFKKFIESRGHETGGWRGEIHGETVVQHMDASGG